MTPQIKQRLDQIQRGEVPKGYKRTRAGVIPNEWEIHPLSKHLTESRIPGTNGAVAKKLTVKLWNKGVYEKREVHEGSESTSYYKRKSGQLIYSKLDFLNCAFGIIPEHLDGYESTQDLPCFDIFGVDPFYLLTYVTQRNFYTHFGMIADGGRKARRVGPEDMLSFPLVYPPLPEQQKIAEILSAQDKLIALKEKLIEEKKRQKKYLMQQLLTGKKRLPGFDGEWEIARLKDVATYATKRSVMPQNSYLSTENILPNYSGVDFFDGDLSTEGVCFQSDDILLSNIRPYLKKAWLSDRTGICSADILVLRATKIKAKYLYYIIARDEFVDYVMNGVKGTKMPRGDKQHILQMEFDFPSLQEQSAIINILSTADRELDLLSHALNQEKQKKKALMQLLLTGIVRV